jgi:hypothetical protein
MFKETLHPQKPGKWKIFLESRFDNYCASGNIEHDIVQIRNVKAADAQCFFFGPIVTSSPKKRPMSAWKRQRVEPESISASMRSVLGELGTGSAKLTFRIAE